MDVVAEVAARRRAFCIRRHGDTKSSGNALTTIAEESEGQQKASETFFASVVGQREVCEIHVAVAARDVHCKREFGC